MTTKIKAAMVDADVATQSELDVVSGVANAAAEAAALKLTGDVVQVVNTQTGAVSTGTTVIQNDDTIPQIGEGDEYMTLAETTQALRLLMERAGREKWAGLWRRQSTSPKSKPSYCGFGYCLMRLYDMWCDYLIRKNASAREARGHGF